MLFWGGGGVRVEVRVSMLGPVLGFEGLGMW